MPADPRRTSRTPRRARTRATADWAPAFLAALRDTGMVSAACEAAGVGRQTVYDRRQRDEQFAVAWASEIEGAVAVAAAEAWRRAVAGVERPVTVAGKREVVREYTTRC
jgi:hypothetical protein